MTPNELLVVQRELQRTIDQSIPGDVVEFGCYVGTTSVFLADKLRSTNKRLYLYDSFEGLPLKTSEDESPIGVQFIAGELQASKKQLIKNLKQAHVPMPTITKGWFSELVDTQIPETISFAFLDGDYYHSVRDSLDLIWSHLSADAVVIVDDYANEALPGAAKAVDEWLKRNPIKRISVESSLAIIELL